MKHLLIALTSALALAANAGNGAETPSVPDTIKIQCNVPYSDFGGEGQPVETMLNNVELTANNVWEYPARGERMARYEGTGTKSLGRGYELELAVEFMPKSLFGDFVKDYPTSVVSATLLYKGHVIATNTSSANKLETQVGLRDTRFFDQLHTEGAHSYGLLEYGWGFNSWASLRDHLSKATGNYTKEDVQAFLVKIDRAAGVITDVSASCKFPGQK